MSDGFVASGKRVCGAIDLSVVRSFGEEHLVPKGGKSGPKGVKHEFIQRYLTEKDWSVLGSQSFDMTSKIRTVIQRCKLMGLKSMCEQTAKRVAALLKLASHTGPPDLINPDPVEFLWPLPCYTHVLYIVDFHRIFVAQGLRHALRFLGLVRDIKCMLKLAWKGSSMAPWDTTAYPADPHSMPDVSRWDVGSDVVRLRC